MNTDMYIISLTEFSSGETVYDIQTEDGIVANEPADAQKRTQHVSNIRADLLRATIGSEFSVQVLLAPAAP